MVIFEDYREEDIDQNLMIPDAKTYEDNQRMTGILADKPQREEPQPGVILAEEDRQGWKEEDKRVRRNKVRKRKGRRVRGPSS